MRMEIYTLRILRLLGIRSEEHTSELQSRPHLVCRLLLEKKKTRRTSGACTPRLTVTFPSSISRVLSRVDGCLLLLPCQLWCVDVDQVGRGCYLLVADVL